MDFEAESALWLGQPAEGSFLGKSSLGMAVVRPSYSGFDGTKASIQAGQPAHASVALALGCIPKDWWAYIVCQFFVDENAFEVVSDNQGV